MMYALVFLIITAVSFIFAMLGLGGGSVYVPVITWFGFPMKEVAIPLGLLLNGLNTLFAMIPFARKRLIDWKGGAVMAISAMIGSSIGAFFTEDVDTNVLKLLFAAMVIIVAVRTLMVANKQEVDEMMSMKKRSIIGLFVGLFAGFVGGLLGVGGGFIIAPILMWMGYKAKEAAATTAFVVTFSSFSGYFGHMAQGHMNLTLTILLVVSVIIGSQFGARYMSGKAKSNQVKLVYAVVLILIAVQLTYSALHKML
ncbi:MAG: sulfite exporter TauE/SafE family protein [Microbacter sp.]